jgi:protease IV
VSNAAQNKQGKGLILVFFLIIFFFALLLLFAHFTLSSLKESGEGNVSWGKSGGDVIGVVEVKGVIFESKKVIENLLRAEKDKSVKAIILRVESPGGSVGPTQEIYDEIIRIDKEKPVYASFGSIAASGGYYIGAACRKIYANAGTLTGSIGVIMHFMDLSKLYEFAKVKPGIIKSGLYKDIGSPHRKMTKEEKLYMKNMLSGVHDQFKNHIMARRKSKIKGNIDDHAQGQIFSGTVAKELGLVDEIASLWTAGRAIFSEMNLKGDFKFKYIKEKRPFSLRDLVDDVEGIVEGIKFGSHNSFMPMYMMMNNKISG